MSWDDIANRRIQPPKPYLAEYAKSIIQVSPYMAAGHPQTTGRACSKEHPNYVHGWSFAEEIIARASSGLQRMKRK